MSSQEIVANTLATYWNVKDQYKEKTLDQLREVCDNDSLPFAVCAINITGDLNLGIMMRTASLLGAERFIIYGKHTYDRRSTVGAHNYIDIVKAGSIDRGGSLDINYDEFFPIMNSFGYQPVFLETGGQPLENFDPKYSIGKYKKPCLVFGNEGIGIEPSLMVDQVVVSIHQRGVLRSFNVCAAAAIAIEHTSRYFRE